MVFVALANGQMVIFSREEDTSFPLSELSLEKRSEKETKHEQPRTCGGWLLESPKMISLAPSEQINTTNAKLCQVSQNLIWCSYGRNIIIFDANSLSVLSRILIAADLDHHSSSDICIEEMQLTSNNQAIWILFNQGDIIQLYDVKRCLLMGQVNIREAVDRILSYGNEIIRQHKMATLRATSLSVVENPIDQSDTLFIGTSAGLVLFLNLRHESLLRYEHEQQLTPEGTGKQQFNWNPQLASLGHGHSGMIKFLQCIPVMSTIDVTNTNSSKTNINIITNNSNVNINMNESNSIIINNGDSLVKVHSGSKDLNNNNNTDSNGQPTSNQSQKQTKSPNGATSTFHWKSELLLVSGGPGVDLYGPNEVQRHQRLDAEEDNVNHLVVWKL